MRRILITSATIVALAGVTVAQYRYRQRNAPEFNQYRTAREVPGNGEVSPAWENPPEFAPDVFTFARVIYSRSPHAHGWAGNWTTDCPDSDLNFSFRLQQMTSIRVDPDGRLLTLTDPELFQYPWIYMVEPGGIELQDDEVPILRRYLLNGGFLMADDFWGETEWEQFEHEIARVFPDRKFSELSLDHPVYHSVFPIREKRQVPAIHYVRRAQMTGQTAERPDAEEVHHRVILNDRGHIMVIACHNTDNGDGWEREGEDAYYFREFSEKTAYPLGINIVVYAMTH